MKLSTSSISIAILAFGASALSEQTRTRAARWLDSAFGGDPGLVKVATPYPEETSVIGGNGRHRFEVYGFDKPTLQFLGYQTIIPADYPNSPWANLTAPSPPNIAVSSLSRTLPATPPMIRTPEGSKATFTLEGLRVASPSRLVIILGFRPESEIAVFIHGETIDDTSKSMHKLSLSNLRWSGLNKVVVKMQSNGRDDVHAIDNFEITWDN